MIRTKLIKALLSLIASLMVGNAWGQTTILAAGNRDTVHTRTEIIYVEQGGSRELYLPELRINDGVADASYQWYVHWYISKDSPSKGKIEKPTKAIYLDADAAKSRGGDINGGYYASDLRDAENGGLWWYKGFYDVTKYEISTDNKTIWKQLSSCASTIVYTAPESLSKADTLFCDVSSYTNFNEDELNDGGGTFKEPTLLKRYKYIIRPASECANALKEGPLEKYEIDYPAESKSSINLTMLSLPGNYFWYESGNSGNMISAEGFEYRIGNDGSYVPFSEKKTNQTNDAYAQLLKQLQVVKLSGLDGQSKQVVSVRAINGGEGRPILAQYTFNPISDSGFKLEEEIIPDNRAPEKFPDLYEEIGVVDFDQEDVISTSELEADIKKNMATNPMPQDETVYGFMFNNISSVRVRLTPMQNQYGLYRTANVPNISINSEDIKIEDKDYRWIPPLMNPGMYGKRELYDRTYERTKDSHGFFYYIDASDDPGTLVDVPIKGTLCGYTELVVTAWLADMTRPLYVSGATSGLPLAPNINLILKGTDPNTGEEVVLHYFTSGDAITDYGPSNNEPNKHLMKWQQLCYRITLTDAVQNYTDFHLEVQNNEPHTDGADYAIDDVRIYKSKPNIKVQRENECDASTLLISTDFPTILRNMGWTAGEPAVQVSKDEAQTNLHYRKYRYGLMGEAHEHDANSYAGNVYFAFLSEDLETWQTVNKKVEGYPFAAKSLRVAASTELNKDDFEFYVEMDETLDPEEAMAKAKADAIMNERIMNYRAVLDYNQDVEAGLWENEGINRNNTIVVSEDAINPESGNFNEEAYETALVELFGRRLGIPRIRCPWYDTKNDRLYLAIIDVNNTDLKYQGQIESQDADPASGNYWVVTFSAAQVAGFGEVEGFTIDPKNNCTLKSPFTVLPATTVLIDAVSPNNPNIAICQGTLHTLEAYLNFFDKETGEAIENDKVKVDYIFDWYLGPEEGDYNVEGIKAALEAYRDANGGLNANVAPDAIQKWATGEHEADGELLIELIEKDLLLLGIPANEPFDLVVDAERIVAMPYVPDVETENTTYAFCSDITEVNLGVITDIVPNMYQGFFGVEYPKEAEVALRLGQRHITQTLDLPIYKVDHMASTATSLGLGGEDVDIYLEVDESVEPIKIGEASGLSIPLTVTTDATGETTVKVTEQGFLTFTLNAFTLNNEEVKSLLHEGQSYTLLIPFAQYNEDKRLDSACDGLLRLPVKIVPEYLTWAYEKNTNTGKESVWYDDKNWRQSDEAELYMGDKEAGQDVNGDDVITNAFSPLYFSKITLLGNDPLNLAEAKKEDVNDIIWDFGENYTIQYDIAVDTVKSEDPSWANEKKYEIKPYYINKVEQVYFKPNATLLNQHLLNYQKAWVEFEMANMEKRWMASPLQNVYAGDIYAPKSNGRQETPAFTAINYDGDNTNSRWAPAFYQKAWNSAVKYSKVDEVPNEANNEIAKVALVKNNWSIEYNDVTVQYPIGKGFYLSVEDIPGEDENRKTLVRLPKADKSYTYESAPTTKALTETSDRRNAGRLAELDPDATTEVYTIQLDNAYNNGDYYLIGNPAMAYLKMEGDDGFLQKNGITKYWTYQEGTFSATVDNMTDEDAFEGGQSNGYIAPMQAFFIEWPDTKGDDETTVSFTPEMFVSKPADSGTESVAYNAFNPTLTLTAERGDQRSVAKLATREDAHDGYEESEDAIALIDSELDVPVVYTVAGTAAAQVNALQAIRNVGLGVYNEAGGEVTVAIEGMSQLTEPLYLYDAKTRKSVELVGDRYELTVDGESHGRYFLRSGLSTDNDRIHTGDDISIYSLRPGDIVVTTVGTPLRSVRVYGIDGDLVTQQSLANQTAYRLNVPRGAIYVVYAEDMDGIIRNVKLRVR